MSGEKELTGAKNPAEPTGAENPADGKSPEDVKPTQSFSNEPPKPDPLKGVVFEDGEELEAPAQDGDQTQTKTPEKDGGETPPASTDGESAKAGDEDPTKPADAKTGDDDKQSGFDKKINKLTLQRHEERRKREAAEERAKKAEEELAKLKGESDEIVIPPLPDTYDPNHDELVKERDRLIEKKAKADAAKELAQKQQQDAQAEKAQAAADALQANVNAMFGSAKEHGIEREDMLKADKTVAEYLQSPELAGFILEQDDSALIIKYLAAAPQELEKIRSMGAIKGAAHIATTIAPEAAKLKPGRTKTPEPLEIPSGDAGGEKESPFLKGVSFE